MNEIKCLNLLKYILLKDNFKLIIYLIYIILKYRFFISLLFYNKCIYNNFVFIFLIKILLNLYLILILYIF